MEQITPVSTMYLSLYGTTDLVVDKDRLLTISLLRQSSSLCIDVSCNKVTVGIADQRVLEGSFVPPSWTPSPLGLLTRPLHFSV